MASNKHDLPALVELAPPLIPRLSGFINLSEVRACTDDRYPKILAALKDEENLQKEVDAYNQSVIKAKTIRYKALLEMSRLNLLDEKTYDDKGAALDAFALEAGLKNTMWKRPPFWADLNSAQLDWMYLRTSLSFSTNELALLGSIEDVGIRGRSVYWEWCGTGLNFTKKLDLNAHLSDEDQKKEALREPQGEVEVYERMRLFQAMLETQVSAYAMFLEEAPAAGF